MKSAIPALAQLSGNLSEIGYDIFISCGTLLGIVRDKKPMEFDDDFDFAVILKSRNTEDAAKEWHELRMLLVEKKLGYLDKDARLILKFNRINGIDIDLFPAWVDEDDKVFVYPHTSGEIGRQDLLPLKLDPISNCMMPQVPEKMLEVNYGQGWTIPNPFAYFNWGRSDKRFKKFISEWTKYDEGKNNG